MRSTMVVGKVMVAIAMAGPVSQVGASDPCPKTTVPSFNACITVDGCTFYPFFQPPFECAFSFCESIVWFPGPPGSKVLAATTGPVTCKVRQGTVGPTGECLGPNPNGSVLSTYSTPGIIDITVGGPC